MLTFIQSGSSGTVSGRVLSALTVSPSELFIGDVKPGAEITKNLIVRGKKPFRITSIGCKDGCFSFKKSDEAKKTHVVPVTFKAPEKEGTVRVTIQIETDLSGAKSSISAHAQVAQS